MRLSSFFISIFFCIVFFRIIVFGSSLFVRKIKPLGSSISTTTTTKTHPAFFLFLFLLSLFLASLFLLSLCHYLFVFVHDQLREAGMEYRFGRNVLQQEFYAYRLFFFSSNGSGEYVANRQQMHFCIDRARATGKIDRPTDRPTDKQSKPALSLPSKHRFRFL